jgi:hypothetical protein
MLQSFVWYTAAQLYACCSRLNRTRMRTEVCRVLMVESYWRLRTAWLCHDGAVRKSGLTDRLPNAPFHASEESCERLSLFGDLLT